MTLAPNHHDDLPYNNARSMLIVNSSRAASHNASLQGEPGFGSISNGAKSCLIIFVGCWLTRQNTQKIINRHLKPPVVDLRMDGFSLSVGSDIRLSHALEHQSKERSLWMATTTHLDMCPVKIHALGTIVIYCRWLWIPRVASRVISEHEYYIRVWNPFRSDNEALVHLDRARFD